MMRSSVSHADPFRCAEITLVIYKFAQPVVGAGSGRRTSRVCPSPMSVETARGVLRVVLDLILSKSRLNDILQDLHAGLPYLFVF